MFQAWTCTDSCRDFDTEDYMNVLLRKHPRQAPACTSWSRSIVECASWQGLSIGELIWLC
jgi:hypothetical protein